jgi:hypothetical protein
MPLFRRLCYYLDPASGRAYRVQDIDS